jgi:phage shock protein PspC (stress-responsive transcriptional regulator)
MIVGLIVRLIVVVAAIVLWSVAAYTVAHFAVKFW